MLIDTHAHLNFNAFKNDLDEVIKRSLAENVWMINVGTKYETSKKAKEIAERYGKGIFAAIGLHPIHSTAGLVKIKTDPEEGGFVVQEEDFDRKKYMELAKSNKVVAIGEIGLDYYYKPKTKKKLALFKEKQKEVFLKQLDLAKELNLPVIFHCRMAHEDLIKILNYKLKTINYKLNGVVHCFTGSWEQAKQYLDMGYYLGINGIIYKFYPVKSAGGGVPPQAGQFNRVNLQEVIEKTPLKRILIETDCPYLTPPEAKKERNEPIFVKYIAQEIAKIKNLDFQEVAKATTQNAKKLFRI